MKDQLKAVVGVVVFATLLVTPFLLVMLAGVQRMMIFGG